MQDLRGVARLSLARGLRKLKEEDRLALALPTVCGSAMAAHATVLGLNSEQILNIRVDAPEWMPSFLNLRERLQHDLARVAGVPLSGLHFELAGRRSAD